MSTSIAIQKSGHHLVAQFVRPAARNPLSSAVLNEIEELLERVEADDTLRTLVFTGTGGSFASGADLREIAELDAASARGFALAGQRIMNRISRLEIRTAAAINGFCFGGGLDLALSCKTRVAASSSVFCHPGVGLGIITGWGGTQRLPRLIGEVRAMEMFFTARRVEADEALRMGLVDAIADDPVAFVLNS